MNQKLVFFLAVFLILQFTACSSNSADGESEADTNIVYVSKKSGSDSNSGFSTESPVATLLKAVEILDNYLIDEIKIAGGTYEVEETLTFSGGQVSVKGGFNINDWTTPDPENNETRITGTDNIFRLEGCNIYLTNLVIVPVKGTEWSRGFSIDSSTVYLKQIKVEPSSVTYPYFEAMGIYHASTVYIENCTLRTGDTTYHQNGFHAMHGSSVDMVDTEIYTGKAGEKDSNGNITGGNEESQNYGIHASTSSMVTMSGCTIENGESWRQNFGINATEASLVEVRDSSEITSGESHDGDSVGVWGKELANVIVEDSNVTASAGENSMGISVVDQASLNVTGSTVKGGEAISSSVGVNVAPHLATALISENVLIEAGSSGSEMYGIIVGGLGAYIEQNTTISGSPNGMKILNSTSYCVHDLDPGNVVDER